MRLESQGVVAMDPNEAEGREEVDSHDGGSVGGIVVGGIVVGGSVAISMSMS